MILKFTNFSSRYRILWDVEGRDAGQESKRSEKQDSKKQDSDEAQRRFNEQTRRLARLRTETILEDMGNDKETAKALFESPSEKMMFDSIHAHFNDLTPKARQKFESLLRVYIESMGYNYLGFDLTANKDPKGNKFTFSIATKDGNSLIVSKFHGLQTNEKPR